ncbi:MAG TPA: hypothetical protein VIK01_06540 [Polyangiaceae bacterium]
MGATAAAATTAPILVQADGVAGDQAFDFTPTTARYLLISDTGMVIAPAISWWSVYDLKASCK